MQNKFKWIFLIAAFFLLSPAPSFAWRDGGGYWNYYGSGRDHPYSDYVDAYYNPGYADYATLPPDYIEEIPKMTLAPVEAPPEIFTVNIPNRQGGYTAVIIKKSGNGYIGPQGEYYPEFPKIFQLEIMYGK